MQSGQGKKKKERILYYIPCILELLLIVTTDIELLSWHSCCSRTGKQLYISAHFHHSNSCMHGHLCNFWVWIWLQFHLLALAVLSCKNLSALYLTFSSSIIRTEEFGKNEYLRPCGEELTFPSWKKVGLLNLNLLLGQDKDQPPPIARFCPR